MSRVVKCYCEGFVDPIAWYKAIFISDYFAF